MVSSNKQDRLINAINLTYISLFNTSNKLCCEENNLVQKLSSAQHLHNINSGAPEYQCSCEAALTVGPKCQ